MTEQSVSIDDLKKLFTQKNAQEILKVMGIDSPLNKSFTLLQEKWHYYQVLEITRQLALAPEGKYDPNKIPNLEKKRDKLISQYKQKYGDELEWVFNPGGFDSYRVKYTRGKLSEYHFYEGVKKHTLVADISQVTSELSEIFLVNQNSQIFPTLKHTKGSDYLYKFQFRDWKNSKSIGNGFIKAQEKKGKIPLEVAYAEPEKVGLWMYENQSDARFGYEPRHFLIYTNNKIISTKELLSKLSKVDFDLTYPITFTQKKTKTEYTTSCLVTYI
jgi:hypothetical protein